MKRLKWGEAKGRGGCHGDGGEQEVVRQCGEREAASMRSYGVRGRLGGGVEETGRLQIKGKLQVGMGRLEARIGVASMGNAKACVGACA